MSTDAIMYFAIPPIVLRVSRNDKGPGRVEHYDQANFLMRRLDVIGRNQLTILEVTEAGQPWAPDQVEVLNICLRTQKGLRSFKRVAKMGWNTKWGWNQFREMNEIPFLAVLVAV